jgi:hypothetical protein
LFHYIIGVTEDEVVPQAYIDKNVPVAQNQIVLGGFRLYALMRYIFEAEQTIMPELFLQ